MGYVRVITRVPADSQSVFDYLTNVENQEVLFNDNLDIQVALRDENPKKGSLIGLNLERMGIKQYTEYVVEEFALGRLVVLKQREGLFKKWTHRMSFEKDGEDTLITEVIEYELPMGVLGKIADDILVRYDLKKIFEDRQRNIKDYFAELEEAQASETATPQ